MRARKHYMILSGGSQSHVSLGKRIRCDILKGYFLLNDMWILSVFPSCFLIFSLVTSELVQIFMGQDDPAISYWAHRIKLEDQYSQNLSDSE